MNYSVMKNIVAIFLLIATLNIPYNYYVIMRFIVTGFALYTCYLLQKGEKDYWFFIFIGIAILFNPILPIHLEKEIWIIFDLLTSLIILVFSKMKKYLFYNDVKL